MEKRISARASEKILTIAFALLSISFALGVIHIITQIILPYTHKIYGWIAGMAICR
jgi:hypothetical protein